MTYGFDVDLDYGLYTRDPKKRRNPPGMDQSNLTFGEKIREAQGEIASNSRDLKLIPLQGTTDETK